jgi:integrase
MGTRKDFKKTKYTGIYVKEDSKTKIKTYLARAKVNGVEIEQIVGHSNDEYKTNASLAFNRRVELINKVKAGNSTKRKDNPTLKKYFDEFQELRKNTISTNRWRSGDWFFEKYISNSLQNKKLRDVTTDDLQRIINKMIDEGKKGSYIKMVKEVFSPMYKKAVEQGVVEQNITQYLKFPKFDNTRYFSLPDEKIKLLVNTIMSIPSTRDRLIFMFLLRGRRSNEVRSLCWEDIDFENKSYIIRDYNNKTRKNSTYLLDDELLEHLQLIRETKGLCFPSSRTGKKLTAIPKKLWTRIQEKVGITMRIHDFRHLLGFTLVNNNVPLENISRALGHSKITTTQRYSNSKELMAKEALDQFFALVKGK